MRSLLYITSNPIQLIKQILINIYTYISKLSLEISGTFNKKNDGFYYLVKKYLYYFYYI